MIPTDVAKPFNYYTVSKLFAEDLGRMYVNRYHMSVIFGRIVFLPRANPNAQHLIGRPHSQKYFLSHGDAGRFFADAVAFHPDFVDGARLGGIAVADHEGRNILHHL